MEAAIGSWSPSRVRPPPYAVAGLSTVGWSHRGTPLAVLERVALSRRERPALLAALTAAGGADLVLLSTCSRTELYAGLDGPAPDALLAALVEHVQLSAAELAATAERRNGLHVVEHLFRVTSGLESRVIGEAEIRSQVRVAVQEAHLAGLAVPTRGPLFTAAGRCALQVNEVTALNRQARSLGRRAVDVGLARVERVDEPVILVVGAGLWRARRSGLKELGHRPQVAAPANRRPRGWPAAVRCARCRRWRPAWRLRSC